MNIIKCKVCLSEITKQGFIKHLRIHNLTKETYYDKYIRLCGSEGFCLHCNKKLKLYGLKYRKFCSCKCSSSYPQTKELRKETNLKKFGTENPFQSEEIKKKIITTNIEKYGVMNPSQSIEIQNKKKETWNKLYGVDHPFKSDIIKQKIKETFNEKYNTDNFMQNELFLKKAKETWKNKYNTDNPHKVQKIIDKVKETCLEKYNTVCPIHQAKYLNQNKIDFYNSLFIDRLQQKFIPLFDISEFNGIKNKYKFKCIKCGNIVVSHLEYGSIPRCLICEPYSQSIPEIEIKTFIKQYYDIVENSRDIINPLELDIYIPEKKLAIEFNGLYWHSEQQGKDKKYHVSKTDACEAQGIQLIHIFEDEWTTKIDIVKSRLKHLLGLSKHKIYGRKCQIKEIDGKICSKFLNKYHIQGNCGSSVKLGLSYKDKLIAVMTFGKRRVAMGKKSSNEGEYELLRYATVSEAIIMGGAGKLLKHFERTYNPINIISYADRRWSLGNLYRQLGFNEKNVSKPCYWYIVNNIRKHRFGYRKNVLNNRLKTFDPILTEYQNMLNNKIDRIWDCGNYVFEKTIQPRN